MALQKKILLFVLSLFQIVSFSQKGPGGIGYEDISDPGQPELVLWLIADQQGLKDGEEVSTWEDLSGNSHHALSGSSVHPVYLSNGINNEPSIYFNGESWFRVPEKTNLDGGHGISIFVIVQPQAIDNGSGMKMITKRNHWNLWGGGLSKETCKYSYNLDFHSRDNNQYVMAHVNGNLPDNKVETEAIYSDTSQALLVDYIYAGDYAAVRVNGINNHGNKPNPNFSVGGTGDVEDYDNEVTVGAAKYEPQLEGELPVADFLIGKISEIAIYRCAIDSTQLQIIENYFAAKYKLNIADDRIYTDTTCSYNLLGIGSKDGLNFQRVAGNGLVTLIDKDESIDEAGEFIFFGDDGSEIDLIGENLPDNWKARWSRTWKIEKYGQADIELWLSFTEAGIPLIRTKEYGLLYKESWDEPFSTLLEGGSAKFGNLIFNLSDDKLKTGYYTIAERTANTSVSAYIIQNFGVFPNPTNGKIMIRSGIEDLAINLTLIGLSGQVIRNLGKHKFAGNTLIIEELNNIERGMYILRLESTDFSENISLIKY